MPRFEINRTNFWINDSILNTYHWTGRQKMPSGENKAYIQMQIVLKIAKYLS